MRLSPRRFVLPAAAALVLASPLLAPVGAGAQAILADASALPPLPPQTDPWLYRGSDVPHDKEWTFGTLPNGLRWAVRANGVPPGQISIRIRMDVGALNEMPQEAGFAHLLEHLVFRQSKYLGEAQAIPAWQRLGAGLGVDTNAETSFSQTVFKIDLPGATPASFDESMKLLSGMMQAPVLSESDVRAEAPIVLAEKRERGGIAERVADATREVMFAGQPLADHSTIGPVATIEGAHQDSVRAFHDRWYRPENCAIIIAGDADPRLMAALIAKWFGDWPVKGPHVPVPDFGTPAVPPGADPANPVATPRVLVEPELARSLTSATVRPWHEKNDTIVYNQGLMIDQIAQAVINRRLEARARGGAAFLTATIGQENENRSIDATFVAITPTEGRWQAALHDARAVIADALASPPTPDEIAREVAELNVAFESQVQQRALAPGSKLADDLVQALDIHETVAAPEVVWDIFRRSIPLFTPQAVLEHTRRLFTGTAIRTLYVTPQAGEATPEAIRAALLAPVAPDPGGRRDARPISFANQRPIGPVGPPPVITETGLLGIQSLSFANGVHVLFWPTKDDPGRVTVKVRFGAGYRAFQPGQSAYAALGNLALVGSGEGALGQEELDRISAGRKLGFEFKTSEGFFQFTADTRAEDLDDQLYLFADKLTHPRWDAAPVLRARAAARAQYDTFAASPQGVVERDLKYLERGGDTRYATPTPAALAAATPEGFRKVWAPILASGPIEVQVFGDFDRTKALLALQRTFGAMPPRPPLPADTHAASVGFAMPNAQPVIESHQGDANQAAAVVVWPTGGGIGGISDSRRLEVLAQLFSNRLMDALRERLGASYSPQVSADWPVDLNNGGTLTALAQLQPAVVPQFFAAADAIAADLAARPPGADELARVEVPMRQQITRAASSTAFFMWQLEGASADPARVAALRSLLPDYTEVTPERIQALAARFLVKDRAWRFAVLPKGAVAR